MGEAGAGPSEGASEVDAEAIVSEVRRLAGEDDLAARLLVAALAEHLAGDEGTFVVVGGTAVDAFVGGAFGTSEGYPAGWRESLDVDTIAISPAPAGGRERIREALEAAGFQPSSTGGSFSREDIPYVLGIVARHLPDDYSKEHLVQVRLDVETLEPLPVRLAGPEDVLFDYLGSAVATRHQRDWARALAIAEVLGSDLDLGYLYGKAEARREGEFVGDLDRLLAGEPLSTS